LNQNDRKGGNAFTPAAEPQFLGRCGLNRYRTEGRANQMGKRFTHQLDMGLNPRRFTDNCQVEIDQLPTLRSQQVPDSYQQFRTLCIPPFFVTGWEVPADVTQCGGSKHGIAKGMDGNVTIGMSLQPPIMGYRNATKHDMVAIGKGVNIQTLPNTQLHLIPP
jgi:hypothetical protein